MFKRNRFFCGIIVISAGVSVVFVMWLPTSWICITLGFLLIWAGLGLICKR